MVAKKKAVKKTAKKAGGKTAKKAAPKAAKKRTTRKSGSKSNIVTVPMLEIYKLGQAVPRQKFFILANGRPVKHVAELAEVLEDIEDHVFKHHVNPEKNDFHAWVKDVFKDISLAKKMLGVSDKKQLQLVIYKHIAHKALGRK